MRWQHWWWLGGDCWSVMWYWWPGGSCWWYWCRQQASLAHMKCFLAPGHHMAFSFQAAPVAWARAASLRLQPEWIAHDAGSGFLVHSRAIVVRRLQAKDAVAKRLVAEGEAVFRVVVASNLPMSPCKWMIRWTYKIQWRDVWGDPWSTLHCLQLSQRSAGLQLLMQSAVSNPGAGPLQQKRQDC